LTTPENYHGYGQVHAANGSGMPIFHTGHSTIHSHDRDLVLKDILHVPSASKNLVLVHKFRYDNHAFFEFHPWHFSLKDWDTKRLLLKGRCKDGLYPLPLAGWLSESSPNKSVFVVTKPTFDRWHHQLGHASSPIDQKVLSQNNLSSVKEKSIESVCDVCQQAKSHQLPIPKSSSVSQAPLELAFTYVWGPASSSVGHFKYYVLFIDDYSKFTWVYLLKNKSDVFQKNCDFQKFVEHLFKKRILAIQSDWGGEYQKLTPFFQRMGISHHVSCPHIHQQNGLAERKHRHIVEVGLSLLAHVGMPLKFWDEAFSTAAYISLIVFPHE
jgi:hypothetical protein